MDAVNFTYEAWCATIATQLARVHRLSPDPFAEKP